jgi:Tfp pilus assembly protein PilE
MTLFQALQQNFGTFSQAKKRESSVERKTVKRQTRNKRGATFIETTIALAVTAILLVASASLFNNFSNYLRVSSQARADMTTVEQFHTALIPILDGLIWKTKKTFSPTQDNGSILVNRTDTGSATPSWELIQDGTVITQIQPQTAAIQENNGLCVADRYAQITFNRSQQLLSVRYTRTKAGKLVVCLGGSVTDREIFNYSWQGIQEVELVYTDPIIQMDLTLWIKQGDTWYSINAGEKQKI